MMLKATTNEQCPNPTAEIIPQEDVEVTSSDQAPRAQRRRAPKSSDSASPLQAIAAAVRQRRSQAEMTIADAAAWCGVGTRFLVDLEMAKPNLQIEKALTVAMKFGITIAPVTRDASVTIAKAERWVKYSAPANHPQGQEWLAAWHAAVHIANQCKLPVLPIRPVHEAGRLVGMEVDIGPWAGLTVTSAYTDLFQVPHPKPLSPWANPGAGVREENGGPGFEQVLNLIQLQSAIPVVDVATTLRWVLLNCILQDTEHHLGRLRLVEQDGHVRIAPFIEMQCMTSLFTTTPHRGLRIGSAWPEIYLRADHWKKLAEHAGVHPKVIFQMMREMSLTVPGQLEAALKISMKRIPMTGPLAEILKKVQAAASRMGDITQLAERHVSGLKTKQQPKITPVPPQVVVPAVKRFLPVLDDEPV